MMRVRVGPLRLAHWQGLALTKVLRRHGENDADLQRNQRLRRFGVERWYRWPRRIVGDFVATPKGSRASSRPEFGFGIGLSICRCASITPSQPGNRAGDLF